MKDDTLANIPAMQMIPVSIPGPLGQNFIHTQQLQAATSIPNHGLTRILSWSGTTQNAVMIQSAARRLAKLSKQPRKSPPSSGFKDGGHSELSCTVLITETPRAAVVDRR